MFHKSLLAAFLAGIFFVPSIASAGFVTDNLTASISSVGNKFVNTDSNLTVSVSGTAGGAPGKEPVVFGGYDFNDYPNPVTFVSNESQSAGGSESNNYEFLTFTFAIAASQLSFSFDNFGTGNGTTASVYGISGNLLASISVDGSSGGLTNYASPFTGIAGIHSLVFDNKVASSGQDWVFGVASITYDPPSPTPLPGALFFVAPALVSVFGFTRRKQSNKT